MIRFLVAIALLFLAGLGYIGWTHGRYGVLHSSEWPATAPTLLIAPLVAACTACTHALPSPARWPADPVRAAADRIQLKPSRPHSLRP